MFHEKNKWYIGSSYKEMERPLPRALLHDGADVLTDQGQELLRVSWVELLEECEHAEHKRRPVDWVCSFFAGHPYEITTHEVVYMWVNINLWKVFLWNAFFVHVEMNIFLY